MGTYKYYLEPNESARTSTGIPDDDSMTYVPLGAFGVWSFSFLQVVMTCCGIGGGRSGGPVMHIGAVGITIGPLGPIGRVSILPLFFD